jgi:hypothetical protein
MEKFVRDGKPHVTSGEAMDERVLDDSSAAMDETLAAIKPSAAGTILRKSTMRFAAAAAVIIVAIALLLVHRDQSGEQPEETVAANIGTSPAEMLSVISLNVAYRRGGIEAVDDRCKKAFEMLGSQPARVSIRELLAESNGV